MVETQNPLREGGDFALEKYFLPETLRHRSCFHVSVPVRHSSPGDNRTRRPEDGSYPDNKEWRKDKV